MKIEDKGRLIRLLLLFVFILIMAIIIFGSHSYAKEKYIDENSVVSSSNENKTSEINGVSSSFNLVSYVTPTQSPERDKIDDINHTTVSEIKTPIIDDEKQNESKDVDENKTKTIDFKEKEENLNTVAFETKSVKTLEAVPVQSTAKISQDFLEDEKFEDIEKNITSGGEFTEEYKQFLNSMIHEGNVLNNYNGTIVNDWGNKETYYNLDMSGVVSIMRSNGYGESQYPYWERNDGCKMLGPYIMVAANLQTYPRCSIVNTSLGKAIVADTGSFAYYNSNQFDIATNW